MHIPLPDRVDEAVAQMERRLNEALFGADPESRVRDLRRSILKDDAPPEPRLLGLAAVLDDPRSF